MAMSDGLKTIYLDRFLTIFAWILLFCVLFSAIALGGNRPVTWSLLAIFVCLIFVVHLVLDMMKGMSADVGRIYFVAVLFAGTVVWSYFQTLPGLPESLHHPLWDAISSNRAAISADPIRSHHGVMRLLCYGMVFWVGMRVATDVYRAYDFFKVIAVFSTLVAAFGIYAFMIGDNAIVGDLANNRQVVATFANRNSYATYALIGLLANTVSYLAFMENDQYGSTRSGIRNFLENFFAGSWIYAIGFLLCLAAIALTQSRAGAIAALIGIVAFIGTYRTKGKGGNPILLASLLVIVGFVVFTLTSDLTSRLLATDEENARFLIYPEILGGIMERPLLGHGLGSFLDAFRSHVPLEASLGEWDYAHNTYLELIFELGIPAAAAYFLVLFMIALRFWRGTRERQRDKLFACLGLSLMLAVAFHAFFDFTLQMPATASLFALILGMCWTQSFSARSGKKRKTTLAKKTQ